MKVFDIGFREFLIGIYDEHVLQGFVIPVEQVFFFRLGIHMTDEDFFFPGSIDLDTFNLVARGDASPFRQVVQAIQFDFWRQAKGFTPIHLDALQHRDDEGVLESENLFFEAKDLHDPILSVFACSVHFNCIFFGQKYAVRFQRTGNRQSEKPFRSPGFWLVQHPLKGIIPDSPYRFAMKIANGMLLHNHLEPILLQLSTNCIQLKAKTKRGVTTTPN